MDKHTALKFAHILKKWRTRKRLTQEKLAELSDLSVEHIQRLEGRSPSGVRLETLVKLSKALKLSLSIFLKDMG
jgi:transcriptional regulator with XRE-family HTH domain